MSKVKVSVIVPVYKVEKYIHDCMSTILSQTLKDIEIILVDDGSPDNCGKICDDYAKKDSRVKVIHQTNGRQGKARNAGAKIATGEYIGFVDSDDWIAPTMYEELYNRAKQTDADIVMCDYSKSRFIGDKGKSKSRIDKSFLISDVFNVDSITSVNKKSYFSIVVCWNKIFKHDFYLKNVKFPENMIFEDSPVMFSAFAKAKRISVIDRKLYFYRVLNEISMSRLKDETVFDLFKAVNLVLNNLHDFVYNPFNKFIVVSIVRDLMHHLKGLKEEVRENYIAQLKIVVKKLKEMKLYKFVRCKDKLKLMYIFLKGC